MARTALELYMVVNWGSMYFDLKKTNSLISLRKQLCFHCLCGIPYDRLSVLYLYILLLASSNIMISVTTLTILQSTANKYYCSEKKTVECKC